MPIACSHMATDRHHCDGFVAREKIVEGDARGVQVVVGASPALFAPQAQHHSMKTHPLATALCFGLKKVKLRQYEARHFGDTATGAAFIHGTCPFGGALKVGLLEDI